jgi:arylformamidase
VKRIIDLTLPIRKTWRWPVELSLVSSLEKGDSSQVTSVKLRTHWYTHTDAPKHRKKDGKTLDDFPVDWMIGRALILDLSFAGANEAITSVMLSEAMKDRGGKDILILRTDWPQKASWETFDFWDNAPYMTEDGAKWLLAQKPKLVGFDFPQDHDIRLIRHNPEAKRKMPVHNYVLENDILMIEYLTNLWEIPEGECDLIALPLKLEQADGSPTRVIALIE